MHIDPVDLKTILKICKRMLSGYEVWVYGSRVKGGSHEGSDLDLVVFCPQMPDRAFPHMAALKQAFHDSDIPFLIDVVDWALIPTSFRDEILKSKQVIFRA